MNILLSDIKSEKAYLQKIKEVKFSTFTMLFREDFARKIANDESFDFIESSKLSNWVKSSYITNMFLVWPYKSLLKRKKLIRIIDGLEQVSGIIDLGKVIFE